MILVTVGAQMPFDRLIAAVDHWAEVSGCTDIFAQIGDTEFRPKHLRWTQFVNPDQFRELVESADLVVAHAGMGSVLTALELGKPIIVMPRRGALRETRNDHQVATARQLGNQGLVTVAWDEYELVEKLDTQLGQIEVADRIPRQASDSLCSALTEFISRSRSGIVNGIICFGGVDWWYHNRGHYDIQMMRELSRHTPVLYVNSIGMRTPRLSEGKVFAGRVLRKLKSWSHGLELVRENFGVLSPVSIPKFRNTGAAKALLAEQVRDSAAWMGITRPLVWVAVPTAADVLSRIPSAGLVYQRTDRFEHYPGVDAERIRAYDLKLKADADLTLFCSTSVFEDEKPECRAAALVDHGVDYEQFEAAGDGASPEPDDVKAIQHPRIGFVGGIDAHTFDPELFLQTASALPECSFVMVGACSLPEGWCTLKNVHFPGRKPYDEVAAYMAACDVLIMPWNHSPWIKACNPVKLKEYLAVGRPVVSTAFDELERYAGLVHVARDAAEFIEGIRAALATQPDVDAMRQRVKGETWSAKADAVMENLQKAGVSFRGAAAAERRAAATRKLSGNGARENGATARVNNKPHRRPLGLILPSKRGTYWRKRYFIGAAIMALLAIWVTRDAWTDMFRLASRDEESSHIWLVLPVALWLAWVRREEVSVPRRSGYLIAPLVLVFGWLLYSVGDTYLFQSFWHLGAVVIVAGCALSVLGGSVLLRFWPSFAVLVFLVPVPRIVQQQVGLPMQAFTAQITAFVLDTLGTPIALSGSVLQVNGVSVAVAEACNGIRMLFALTLVCFLYAFSTRLSTWTRILIVLMSPFVAIAANVLRLVPTVWLYGYTNSQTADLFHDISGWAMMPVALFGLFSAGALIRWTLAKDSGQPEEVHQRVASSA